MTNGTNERTSKNLQRLADVSRSIVKEQSSHASKDPRRKEKGERTIAFSRRSNQRHRWKGVAFQKDVCTWRRRRIRNIPSSPFHPFDLYHPWPSALFISPSAVSLFLSLINYPVLLRLSVHPNLSLSLFFFAISTYVYSSSILFNYFLLCPFILSTKDVSFFTRLRIHVRRVRRITKNARLFYEIPINEYPPSLSCVNLPCEKNCHRLVTWKRSRKTNFHSARLAGRDK